MVYFTLVIKALGNIVKTLVYHRVMAEQHESVAVVKHRVISCGKHCFEIALEGSMLIVIRA